MLWVFSTEIFVSDVYPNETPEPIKNSAPGSVLTGTTVNLVESADIPLATPGMGIWFYVAVAGAGVCLLGFILVTVVFIVKKKKSKAK